jgi:hypothetical protein
VYDQDGDAINKVVCQRRRGRCEGPGHASHCCTESLVPVCLAQNISLFNHNILTRVIGPESQNQILSENNALPDKLNMNLLEPNRVEDYKLCYSDI